MDPLFRVEVIAQTLNPQQTIYGAMHQDYAEGFVWDERGKFPDETKAGEIVVNQLLSGGRGHFGPLEHPQIVLNCGWFPHSTMQQIRTHRVGISFDVQSFRYTGKRLIDAYNSIGIDFDPEYEHDYETLSEIFYLRPPGFYTDRQGKKYEYTVSHQYEDLEHCYNALELYNQRIKQGFSEEHARGLIPFDVRQHWVMSVNVRSLMHLLDLRWKMDAQLECQQLCDLIWPHFQAWVPAIADWYEQNRAKKARLAP
jgi:thymidylate synthase (FAD)